MRTRDNRYMVRIARRGKGKLDKTETLVKWHFSNLYQKWMFRERMKREKETKEVARAGARQESGGGNGGSVGGRGGERRDERRKRRRGRGQGCKS